MKKHDETVESVQIKELSPPENLDELWQRLLEDLESRWPQLTSGYVASGQARALAGLGLKVETLEDAQFRSK